MLFESQYLKYFFVTHYIANVTSSHVRNQNAV